MGKINAIILITLLAPDAHAQVTIEASKITCEQHLAFSVADPRDINIWLNGYYNGKSGSTVVEPQRLKEEADKLFRACLRNENSKLPVMQVIEKVLR
jgi:acid stress chaperone HdeB